MTRPPLWSVPVLMYHEIRESAKATWPKLAVSPDAFRAQLAYLSDAGYTTLTASALASLLAKGGKGCPGSLCTIPRGCPSSAVSLRVA
jgi:hypothetical protein